MTIKWTVIGADKKNPSRNEENINKMKNKKMEVPSPIIKTDHGYLYHIRIAVNQQQLKGLKATSKHQ